MSKYNELLRALADGKRLETAYAGSWHPMTEDAAIDRMARGDDIEWREAPKMVRQVACDVPAPMSAYPMVGDLYYRPNPAVAYSPDRYSWDGGALDHRLFHAGLCYATREDAIARARAMLKIEPV